MRPLREIFKLELNDPDMVQTYKNPYNNVHTMDQEQALFQFNFDYSYHEQDQYSSLPILHWWEDGEALQIVSEWFPHPGCLFCILSVTFTVFTSSLPASCRIKPPRWKQSCPCPISHSCHSLNEQTCCCLPFVLQSKVLGWERIHLVLWSVLISVCG